MRLPCLSSPPPLTRHMACFHPPSARHGRISSPAQQVISSGAAGSGFRPALQGQDFVFYTPLTHHKACFHPPSARYGRISSPAQAGDFVRCHRLRISTCPPRAGFRFLSPSHTPQGEFSPFTRKRTFAFSLAPTWRVFMRFPSPRGKAACAILNPRQRVAASSPGWSRACGVTRG